MLEYGSSIMYYPLRHESNVNKESMLNSSATSLLDGSGGTGRPFGSSAFTSQSGAAPGFHHTGNLQGLHNQGSYNMQTMPNALSSRNTGFGGPAGVAHQSGGNVASGRFSTNNLGVVLSQLSQGGLHGHSSMTNRTGSSVVGNHSFSNNVSGVGGSGVGSPGSSSIGNRGSLSGMGGSPSQMGSVGPRIASSVGGMGGGGGVSLAGGGGLTRALNAGGGVNMQNLNSLRVNMGQLSGSSGIGVQGPGRPANSLLQQGVNMSSSTYNPSENLLAMLSRASPQGVSSLLGNNFSTSPSSGMQGQLHSANGHIGGMSPGSVGNGNDGVAFDINDFPQLTTRQSPSGNMQGTVAILLNAGDKNRFTQQQQQMGMSGTPRESTKLGGSAQQADRFGLLGLLSVIRMSDPDLTTLALGTDLTTLGLNLNSRENLYKTFASPWADEPVRGEPEFVVPPCYDQKAPQLQANHYTKFQDNTLFYIFYSMPRDEAQLYAADELSNRGWFFHKELKRWLKRAPNSEPMVKTPSYVRGTFFFLDPTSLEMGCKENFVLHYDMLEKRPQLPGQ